MNTKKPSILQFSDFISTKLNYFENITNTNDQLQKEQLNNCVSLECDLKELLLLSKQIQCHNNQEEDTEYTLNMFENTENAQNSNNYKELHDELIEKLKNISSNSCSSSLPFALKMDYSDNFHTNSTIDSKQLLNFDTNTISPIDTSKKSKIYDRPTPKKHSCIETIPPLQFRQKKRHTARQRSQPPLLVTPKYHTSRPFTKLEYLHPDIALLESNTLFPQRIPKRQLDLCNQKQKKTSKSSVSLIKPTLENNSVNKVINNNELKEKQPNSNKKNDEITWHDVFERSSCVSHKVNSSHSVHHLDKLCQTSPLKCEDPTKDESQTGKSLYSIQLMPPVIIHGTCKIQELPQINIASIKRDETTTGLSCGVNNGYIEIIYDDTIEKQKNNSILESNTNDRPVKLINSNSESQTEVNIPSKTQKELASDEYSSNFQISTSKGSSSSYDRSIKTTSPSSLICNSNNTEYKPKSSQSVQLDLNTNSHDKQTVTSSSSLSSTSSLSPKPFFGQINMLDIIDEIFDSSQESDNSNQFVTQLFLDHQQPPPSTPPQTPLPPTSPPQTHLPLPPLPPPQDHKENVIQIKKSPIKKNQSTSPSKLIEKTDIGIQISDHKIMKTKSIKQIDQFIQTDYENINQPNENELLSAQIVFDRIRNDKIELISHQTNQPISEIKNNPITLPPPPQQNITTQIDNNTNPEIQLNKLQYTPRQKFTFLTPIERLNRLRNNDQYSELIENHPEMLRTINSIQQEAAATAALSIMSENIRQSYRTRTMTTSMSTTFRSNYPDDSILMAAQKFLDSINKTKRKHGNTDIINTTTTSSSSASAASSQSSSSENMPNFDSLYQTESNDEINFNSCLTQSSFSNEHYLYEERSIETDESSNSVVRVISLSSSAERKKCYDRNCYSSSILMCPIDHHKHNYENHAAEAKSMSSSSSLVNDNNDGAPGAQQISTSSSLEQKIENLQNRTEK